MKQLHLKLICLSILTAILMSIAWPPISIPGIIFIGLVPILLIEYLLSIEKEKYGAIFILYSYIGLILWNTFCTRWLYFATPPGGIVAIVLNALLMCIPLYLFYCTKKAHGNKIGYISLPIYWLSFEYLHLNWELSWTWLNIGNGLCDMTNLIQWYVYTGVLGGTLWVWVINISLFLVVKYLLEKNRTKSSKWLKLAMIFIFLPFGISILTEQKNKIKTETMEVIVVQPNIDPYHEKYGSMSYRNQLARMIRLSDSLITDQTRLVVWPETAVLYIDMDRLEKESLIKMMRGFIDKHPKITIISGIVGNRFYNNRKTITAQTFSNGACCYDEYNAAIRLDSSSIIETYNKSKLVPLVENIPYGEVFHGLSIDLGGTVGSLAKDEQRKAFGVGTNKVAPIICYESIYGSFVGDFVQEGAELLLILTNDAWWYYPEKKGGNMIGSRLGYQQHFSYAKMRAIESGKAIARAANTGLSGFIDINGNVIKQTKYWEKDALIAKLPISKEPSFYHKHGDYIGRICGILSIFIILVMIVSKKTEHYKFRKT